MIISAVSFLFLDKLRSLQEMVLHPVLSAVQDEWVDHHNEEEFQVSVTFEYTQDIHWECDQNFGILEQEPEDEQFCNGEDHQPDK